MSAGSTRNIRRRTWELLEVAPDDGARTGPFQWVDRLLLLLIILNVIAVIAETVPAYDRVYSPWFIAFNAFSVIVFTVEYAARLWSCTTDDRYSRRWRGRLRWMVTPMGLIDLAAILPFYLVILFPSFFVTDLRWVRILRIGRLFRVLKLGRYSDSFFRVGRVIQEKRSDLAAAVFFIGVFLVIASTLIYNVENEAQPPTFESIPATMLWGVSTLTGTPLSDAQPVTFWGRLLAVFVVVLGVALFAVPAGILASGFTEDARAERGARNCPHCGKSFAIDATGLHEPTPDD